MARTTKQLSGGGKDKFLRAIISGECQLPTDAAVRLGDSLCASIADIRVRRDTWEALRDAPISATSPPHPPAPPAPPAQTPPAAPVTLPEAQPLAAATSTFDPFSFSALATLAKKGADALAARLSEIESAADLQAIATAQHLAVDAKLTELGALRAALLAATQARLDERRAAAS